MSEVTYDALRKRLAAAEEELSIWKSVFPDIAPERVMPDHSLLHAEIKRLRAGGCARDQTTTQYCAEAVALQSENARLKDAIHDLAKHLWRGDFDKLQPETRNVLEERNIP